MANRSSGRNALTASDTSSSRYLLPDEDADEFVQFSDSILQELAPAGSYQRHMAVNLVHVEWDILRHRRLLAAVLRTEFRRMSEGVEEKGVPGHASMSFRRHADFQLGKSLLMHDLKAEETLNKTGVLRSEITAAAMAGRSETVAYHEARMADLERRRRQLLADLDRMKVRKSLPEDPEDAIEVI
jgi:hypothetical protein